MPWKVEKGHGCPASKPWAVVKETDGAVEGCHPSQAAAQKQQAALYANENKSNPRGDVMPDFPIPVVRDVPAPVEIRAETPDDGAADTDPNSLGMLQVRFSTFNQWYRVASLWEGEFLERIAPGAFRQTFKEDQPAMRVLFDHGFDTIGNKVLGPIRSLSEQDDAPVAEVPLFDTSYNRDLLPGLRAGVYGSSFRMTVREESWLDEPDPSEDNPKGLPERTIRNAKVFEFGPVTFPANPGATAQMRSATDAYMDRLAQRDASAFEAALRSVQQVRPDFTGAPAARSDGAGDRTTEPPSETPPPPPGNGRPVSLRDLPPEQRHLLLQDRGVIRA